MWTDENRALFFQPPAGLRLSGVGHGWPARLSRRDGRAGLRSGRSCM